MHTVYILHSSSYNKIYIGCTGNLEARLLSHNQLGKKGWTIKYRPWILVHQEKYDTKSEALSREKELKTSKCRKWIWEELLTKR